MVIITIVPWAQFLSTGVVGTALGGALTAVGKGFWVRWIEERTLPTQELLLRLKNGKLTGYGRRRLEGEGHEMLGFWRRALPVPLEGQKLSMWPSGKSTLFARSLTEIDHHSSCPLLANRVSPLYLQLEGKDTPELVDQLQAELRRLDEQFTSSKALISQLPLTGEQAPPVWISALNITVREKQQITELLQKLTSEIGKLLPTATLVLEVYASTDFAFLMPGIDSNDCKEMPVRPAARYALLRDRASRFLSKRAFLGQLMVPDKPLPTELIQTRLDGSLKVSAEDFSTWRTLGISGPPGSGKTELAWMFLQRVPASAPITILAAVTPGILKALRSVPGHVTPTETQEALTAAICEDALSLVPSELRTTTDWRVPLSDTLLAILQKPLHEVLVVIDDSHLHMDVMGAVVNLSAAPLNFRFLLVGRSRIQSIPGEKVVRYECRLWERSDANTMLRTWVSRDNHSQIDRALQYGWPARQSVFSLYLLRAMAEHIDSLETAPSELLQKAVRGHIAPISQVLALQDEPATIVLQRLKRILSNPDSGKEELIKALGSKTTLDTAQLLGILAWHTNFDQSSGFQGAFLQAERVVQYSKGLVPSIEIAEQLLNAGAQAKIFDQAIGAFNNVYAWRDKLVADGCASLYLAYEIELGGMDDHTIAVCLECLHKKNSLDILALALDLTLILRIIEVIISTRADLAHILNSLLTVEVVDRLGRMSGCLDEVGRGLFQLAVVDLTRLPDVAAALARVIGSNENTRLECRASIRSSTPECMTALAALAIEHMDSDEFFRELEREPLPSFMAPVALEAAARVWTGEGWSKLGAEASSLLDSNVSEERVESAWFCWLNRQSIDHTLQVALRLIDGAENIRPKSAAFLAAVALKHIAKTSSPVDRQTRIEMFRRIGAHVKSLAAPDLYRRAADIVKWLAVLHAPEIFGPSDDWKLSRDGTVAFLRDPRRNSVNEIFSQLAKVRSWFRLASTSELKALGPVSGLELVNDSLGSDFSYAHNARLYAGQVQAWDGNKFTVVSKSQFQNESFLWRARFDLSSGS